MRRYFLLAVLAASVWGMNGGTIQILELNGNGCLFSCLKMNLGILVLLLPLAWRKEPFWRQARHDWQRHWKLITFSSVSVNVATLCAFMAFAVADSPTMVATIICTSPLISSLIAQVLRKRVQWQLIVATVLCFAGTVLTVIVASADKQASDGAILHGSILAVTASLLLSVWALTLQRFGQAAISDYRITVYQVGTGVVLLNTFTVVTGSWELAKTVSILTTPHQAGWLLSNVIACYIGVVLYLHCIRRGGTANIDPARFAEALTTPFWAWAIVGTTIAPIGLIGVAITVAGGYIAMRASDQAKTPLTQPAEPARAVSYSA